MSRALKNRYYLTGEELWRGDRVLEKQDVQLLNPIIAKRWQLWATATRPIEVVEAARIKKIRAHGIERIVSCIQDANMEILDKRFT